MGIGISKKMIELKDNKLIISLLACFPILIGVYFGAILRKRISESFFKTLFNIMLVLMGGLLIIKIIF